MGTTIIFLLVGIAISTMICYLFRNGGKISIKAPKTDSNNIPAKNTNTTNAKTWPAIFGKIIATLVVIFVAIWLFIFVFSLRGCGNHRKNDENKTEQNSNSYGKEKTLMINTKTPCSPTCDYSFNIKVGGPVSIKFPGIPYLIYWDGKEDIQFPDRESGPMEIKSTNPKKPNVYVKIWEK